MPNARKGSTYTFVIFGAAAGLRRVFEMFKAGGADHSHRNRLILPEMHMSLSLRQFA